MLRKIGVLLISAAVFFAGRLYAQKQKEQAAQEDAFLSLLAFLRVRICDCVPLYRLYHDFSSNALDACGFTTHLRTQKLGGLSDALKSGKPLLRLDDTFLCYLSDFADEIGQVSSCEDGKSCCDKYSRLLEQHIGTTRPLLRSRVDVAQKMGAFAALFCIVLFL